VNKMSERRLRHRELERNSSLENVREVYSRIQNNRTLFNMSMKRGDYKLRNAYVNIRNLEYRSDKAVTLLKFDDYMRERGAVFTLGMQAQEKPRPQYPADEGYRNTRTVKHYPHGEMLVLVEESIYNPLKTVIDRYVLDVGRDGYWATVHTIKGGKPADVKKYIKQQKPVGALLVGSIAVPWFEIGSDQFPCDLYYMDLDGKWSDPDGNGKFNSHTGDVEPEIWIGRLWTPTKNGDDVALLKNYFNRNHKFRTGDLGHAFSALSYVDDDWTGFGDCALDHQFPSSVIEQYTNPLTTDADLYKAEVNATSSWVQLCAHSWTKGHAFTVGASKEYINESYFRDQNPPNSHFYNLFCCGPGKFTTPQYLAGWYIFDKGGGGMNPGLLAVASAKSGSMLFFEDFYSPLGQGKVIGDAFVSWWKDQGPSYSASEIYWYYGLVLLGDPTLTWWKGIVPKQVTPQNRDEFDHYPRKTEVKWEAVDVPGARYTVEVDAFGAINGGKWAEETNQTFAMYHNLNKTKLDHNFVGMQRGRWRVRARINNRNCSWSPWSYFRYKI